MRRVLHKEDVKTYGHTSNVEVYTYVRRSRYYRVHVIYLDLLGRRPVEIVSIILLFSCHVCNLWFFGSIFWETVLSSNRGSERLDWCFGDKKGKKGKFLSTAAHESISPCIFEFCFASLRLASLRFALLLLWRCSVFTAFDRGGGGGNNKLDPTGKQFCRWTTRRHGLLGSGRWP